LVGFDLLSDTAECPMSDAKSHWLLSGRDRLPPHCYVRRSVIVMNQAAFTLDHIVIAVANLDQAVADYRALGFTVYPGGVHHGGVSHNALVIFADGSYFELISYLKPAPDVRWWKLMSSAGEGLVDFALCPENATRDATAARARGLALDGPIDGGRLRPDGVRLDWQIVRPHTNDLPFWCGDVTPRNLRVPEGDMRKHENGVTGISRVVVAVSDLAASKARYRALLGSEPDEAPNDAALVHIGDFVIDLRGPGNAAASAQISQRGEGPLAIMLHGRTSRHLSPQLTHGARLSIAP
jgi:catechol 2,3-dioxygenase-like lactoylglutathione lyase family enzyme